MLSWQGVAVGWGTDQTMCCGRTWDCRVLAAWGGAQGAPRCGVKWTARLVVQELGHNTKKKNKPAEFKRMRLRKPTTVTFATQFTWIAEGTNMSRECELVEQKQKR